MQKNKIDVVKAVCNNAAKKLAVLGLALAVSGGGVVVNAQHEPGFNKTFETKDGKTVSVVYDSKRNRLNINGEVNVCLGEEENEENAEGRTSIYRPGRVYPHYPATISISVADDEGVPVILQSDGIAFDIESDAESTLRNLLNAICPQDMRVRMVCRDFLERREIREETNTTTTHGSGFLVMLNPFNWFGGCMKGHFHDKRD